MEEVLAEIGIKLYKLKLYDNHVAINFAANGLGSEPKAYFRQMLSRNIIYNDAVKERTYRATLLPDGPDYFHGVIQYGIYGIASNINRGLFNERRQELEERDQDLDELLGAAPQLNIIHRTPRDVEETPIYFMVYFPNGQDTAYVAIQTYQTRSCAQLVLGHLLNGFNGPREHLGQRLTASKVMLSAEEDPATRNRPVKEITLIRNRANADRFDRYVRPGVLQVKLKLTISALRGRSLGSYIDLFNGYQARQGDLLVYDGLEFEKAVALIDLGNNKKRKVNLIGYNSSAGVIDITDLVDLDENEEHPTTASMCPIFRESIGDVAERLAEAA